MGPLLALGPSPSEKLITTSSPSEQYDGDGSASLVLKNGFCLSLLDGPPPLFSPPNGIITMILKIRFPPPLTGRGPFYFELVVY